MHELTFLYQLVVIFAVAVLVVVLLGRIGLPGIAGMIVAGVLIGPSGLGFIQEMEIVEALAEVGVVLLLFTIGLELSLAHLRRIWRLVVLGGGIQVLLTAGIVAGASMALGRPWPQSVFFGFLAALSSTAIVMRGLSERNEVDAPHGRMILGVLIFQDLCVVPMMLVVPLLASGGQEMTTELLTAMGKAVGVVVVVGAGARLIVPRLLALIAAERKRDLFVLTVLLICMGTAWLTALSGLSLALGAFLAGLVLAESGYGHQAMSDVLPFRDSFTSLFFVSVGMLFDVRVLAESPLTVLGLFAGIVLGKFLIAGIATMFMRFPVRIAALSGIGLAQVGEFSFVLAKAGAAAGLIDDADSQRFLAAAVFSMIVTPLLVRVAPHFAAGMQWLRPLERVFGARGADEIDKATQKLRDHVIIAGFGLGGRTLAAALKNLGIPYLVLELNPATVKLGREQGEPIYYGDVSSSEVLAHMNCSQAREIVLMINDSAAARQAISSIHRTVPDTMITVRTRYFDDVPALQKLGATDVVVEEFENAVELMARVLRRAGTPRNLIAARIGVARHSRDELVRPLTLPRQRLSQFPEMMEMVKVESYMVTPEDWAVGRSCRELELRQITLASVVALRREEAIVPNPPPDEPFRDGDIVYLLGEQQAVTAAMELLETGRVKTYVDPQPVASL